MPPRDHEPESISANHAPTDRRQFAASLARGLVALPIVGGLIASLRIGTHPLPVHGPDRISLGRLSELPERGLAARPIRYRRRIGARTETVSDLALVGRRGEEIVAMSSRCTHVGCRVLLNGPDAERPIVCPCHDAAFDADGRPVDGPANQPLDRLPIEVVGEGEDAEVFWLRGS